MKTLVFDLDETLVHASLAPKNNVDHVLELAGQTVYLQVRPGVQECIQALRKKYTCRVWSTGQPIYVKAVCKVLNIDWMEHWGRDRCRRLEIMIEGHKEPFDKPLDWITPELDQIIILDNSPGVYACNLENGVPICSWRGEEGDHQLEHVQQYLLWLAEQKDVRRDHRTWTSETLLLRNALGPFLRRT